MHIIRPMRASTTTSSFSSELQARRAWLGLARHWRARSLIGREIGFGQDLGVTEIASADSGFVPASKALTWT